MIAWEKLPPIPPEGGGCLSCPPTTQAIPLSAYIGVGFGYAGCTRDGLEVLEGDGDPCPTVADAEELAAADPDHDWKVILDGPLRGRTFQRHAAGEWVLVAQNQGFA